MTGFFSGKAGTIHARPPKSSTRRRKPVPNRAADLPDGTRDPHMMSMIDNAFSDPKDRPGRPVETPPSPWRTLPLNGRFDLVYEDATGTWSSRSISARELKLGPGRTLLGGIDTRSGSYRGFRVDRIRRLTDGGTGERIETGILDRLLGRADAQRRADAMRIRRQTQARRRTALADRPGAIRTV